MKKWGCRLEENKQAKYKKPLVVMAGIFWMLFPGMSVKAQAEREIFLQRPYVTYSTTGQAWTTNAGDRNVRHYAWGTTVMTGNPSKLEDMGTGQHVFETENRGRLSIGKWVCVHVNGMCIHNSYPEENSWYGVEYGKSTCGRDYFSGWVPYCADCGERLTDTLFYMSDKAAASITRLYAERDNHYYYLCPFCNNLEQARTYGGHLCKEISYNQYRVEYDANAEGEICYGNMEPSLHMYRNVLKYEKETIAANKHLTTNAYTRPGKTFVGWNTRPDGSGKEYEDGAEIYNLTDKDWHLDPAGTVRLYAQWTDTEKEKRPVPPEEEPEEPENEPEEAGLVLTTIVKRILEPHTPVFLRGESGMLTITTHGFAERVDVQFPSELSDVFPELNRTYYYDGTEEEHTELIPFTIPLDMPIHEKYTITVNAYKGLQSRMGKPEFRLKEQGGSILDELRTRLR